MHTVRRAGWSGTKNGALLQLAADAGFDAVVTVDKNIEFQQNPNTLPITVVVLEAQSSDLHVLQPLILGVVSMLGSGSGKSLIKVRAEMQDQTEEDSQSPKFS